MSYAQTITTTIRNEFDNKYGLKTRMTVAKMKKEQRLVKYLERSTPITTEVVDEVKSPDTAYDICLVHTIKDENGSWIYDDQTYIGVETDKVLTDDILNNPRKVLKWLRDNDYLDDSSKGKVKVVYDDDTVEIQMKSNGKPFMAIHLQYDI